MVSLKLAGRFALIPIVEFQTESNATVRCQLAL